MLDMGGRSVGEWVMDALPKAMRQSVSLMIAGGIMVASFFVFLAQPMADMQEKVNQHQVRLEKHDEDLKQQNEKIDRVVTAVGAIVTTEQVHMEELKNITDNQARQENALGKINDKLDKVLERVR